MPEESEANARSFACLMLKGAIMRQNVRILTSSLLAVPAIAWKQLDYLVRGT